MSETPEQSSAEPVIFEESERVSLIGNTEWNETFKDFDLLLLTTEDQVVVGATNGTRNELIQAFRTRYPDMKGGIATEHGPKVLAHAFTALSEHHKNDVPLS